MGTFDVFANVLLLTPKHHADKIFDPGPCRGEPGGAVGRRCISITQRCRVVFKVLGQESEPVQAKVREFWSIVRQTVTGAPVLPKFVWR